MKPLARKDRILAEAVGTELVLYDRQAKKAHRLNPTAAFLWQHCDGTRSMADLAKLLHQEMGVPQNEELVSLALEQLQKQALVNAEVAPAAAGFSRRDALKRLRSLGMAAAMIPVVATIVAPPPAAALSRVLDQPTGSNNFFDDPWIQRRSSNFNGGKKPDGETGPNGLGPWH